MKRPTVLLALVCLLSAPSHLWAWNANGHMTVAALAYRQLSKDVKRKVDEILQEHPDYPKWQKNHADEKSEVDLGLFVFMKASVWPDAIRRSGNPYDHPLWHYIDYPLKPPSFPLTAAPNPDDNILYAIKVCEDVLKDKNAKPAVRAAYLSWLIHLVGDIHQPLHCAMLVNAAYPDGDRGGNDFFVRPADKGIGLHSLWDGLLGRTTNPRTILNDAIQLQSQYKRQLLQELGQATTPKDWSLESRLVAVNVAYLKGELKGSKDADSAPALPDGYAKTAKQTAERRVALAGYRLADTLEELLR